MKLNKKISLLAATSLAALALVGCSKETVKTEPVKEKEYTQVIAFEQCATPEQQAKIAEQEILSEELAKDFCVRINGRYETTPYPKVNEWAEDGMKNVLTQYFSAYVSAEFVDAPELPYENALVDFKDTVIRVFENPSLDLVALPRFADLADTSDEGDNSTNTPVFYTLPEKLDLEYNFVSTAGKLNFYRFDSTLYEPGSANGFHAFPEFHMYNTETDSFDLIPASILKDESMSEVLTYLKEQGIIKNSEDTFSGLDNAEIYFDAQGAVFVTEGDTFAEFVETKVPYDKIKQFIKDEYLATLGVAK